MLLEMFLNELSLVTARDVAAGQVWAERFVQTARAAAARGVQRTIHVPADFRAKPVAPGYYWQDWSSDDRVDRELRRYFRSLTTKTPFLRNEPVAESAFSEIDCYVQSQLALGVKAAYVADGLAVSLPTDVAWESASLPCEIHEIGGDDITSRSANIHHASTPEHVDAQTAWIHARLQATVHDGEELWSRAGDLFPRLVFCSVVEEQMVRLPALSLPSVVRGLFQLNAFCLSWESGSFDPDAVEGTVSTESSATLQQHGGERTFLCPDGHYRLFGWHAKVGRWRIHFDPCLGRGQLLIGYVGKHLQTAKFH
jgi:hypothetical protein